MQSRKWKTKLISNKTPGKPIDLSQPDSPSSANDDSWDSCLDDLDEPSPAAERIKANASQYVGSKKKKKIKRPHAPGTHVRTYGKKVKAIPAVPEIGLHSAPEPNDLAIRRLWRCNTIEEIRELHRSWNSMSRNKCDKSIAKRVLKDSTRLTIAILLDGTATDIPLLVSHQVLALSWETVHRAVYAVTKDDPEIEFAFVTFIAGDGGTSTDAPFIELNQSQDKVVRVLRAISKDFIGVTELAMFNSHGHSDGGRHLQRHEHALIWGHGVVAKARQVAYRRMADFLPNITGAPQIDVRKVGRSEINLARICAYLFKSPHKCMNWNPPKDGKMGHMNQSEKGDRLIRYLRMAQIRSMMTVEDIVFSGGQGIAIRSALIKLLRETSHSLVPIQGRPLHPDEIARFWIETNKELGRSNWQLPVIAKRR